MTRYVPVYGAREEGSIDNKERGRVAVAFSECFNIQICTSLSIIVPLLLWAAIGRHYGGPFVGQKRTVECFKLIYQLGLQKFSKNLYQGY